MRSSPSAPSNDPKDSRWITPRRAAFALSAGAICLAFRGCPAFEESPHAAPIRVGTPPDTQTVASPLPLFTPPAAFPPDDLPPEDTASPLDEDTGGACIESNDGPDWISQELRAHLFNFYDLVIEDLSTDDCTIVDDDEWELELDGTNCDPGWFLTSDFSTDYHGGEDFTLISVGPDDMGFVWFSMTENINTWCICDPSVIPFNYSVSVIYPDGYRMDHESTLCLPDMDEALHRLGIFTEDQPKQIETIRAFP